MEIQLSQVPYSIEMMFQLKRDEFMRVHVGYHRVNDRNVQVNVQLHLAKKKSVQLQ